jgi:hypothetical protein
MVSSNEKKIIQAMKESSGSVGSAYLHLVTEITKTELNRALNSLIAQGKIIRTGRHVHTRYELATKKGLAQAIRDLPGEFKTAHKFDPSKVKLVSAVEMKKHEEEATFQNKAIALLENAKARGIIDGDQFKEIMDLVIHKEN